MTYCLNCFKEVGYKVKYIHYAYRQILDKVILCPYKTTICSECGEEVCVEEIINKDLEYAYNKYKEITGLSVDEARHKLYSKKEVNK